MKDLKTRLFRALGTAEVRRQDERAQGNMVSITIAVGNDAKDYIIAEMAEIPQAPAWPLGSVQRFAGFDIVVDEKQRGDYIGVVTTELIL